jgi:type VII secretion integral membrane protein EccD
MTARTSRITLAGTRRRVDLAVDSTTAVGVLMPDVLEVLDEPAGTAPEGFVLTLPDGRALDPGETLAEAAVPDGTTVLLSRRTDAVPAAVVHDVSDFVVDDLEQRPGRWTPAARRWTATAVLVGAAVAGALLVERDAGLQAAVAAAAVVALLGLIGRRRRIRDAGIALVLAGGAALLVTAPRLVDGSLEGLGLTAGVGAVTIVLVAVITRDRRPALLGVGVLAVLGGGWVALQATGASSERAGGTVAVAGLLALGLLPQLAVLLAGLARLDDRVVDGAVVPIERAESALDTAHRTLVGGAVAAGAGVAAGGAAAAHGSVWGVLLASVVAVVVLLRARTFPLVLARVASLAAGAVVTGALLLRWLDSGGGPAALGVVLLVLAVLALLTLAVEPPEQIRARTRVLADRVEALLVLATLPLLVGLYGVYGSLLEVFG